MMTDKMKIPWRCGDPIETVQRVLIVDDDKNLLNALQYGLADYGLLVTVCENGTEALLRSMFDDFMYIVTDHGMPGMDGVELTRRLRERNPLAVIIGMSRTDRGVDFLEAGANDFLRKPFVPYHLAMMIDGGDLML